jgi:hypothetical protein
MQKLPLYVCEGVCKGRNFPCTAENLWEKMVRTLFLSLLQCTEKLNLDCIKKVPPIKPVC